MGSPNVSIAPMDPTDCREIARALRGNTTDGAAQLGRQAISMLRDHIDAIPVEDLAARTRSCADALAGARPSMAAIGNLVRHWAATFSWPREDFRCRAIAHCDRILAHADRALEATVACARRRLATYPAGSVVLTHSASSTVRAAVAGLPFELAVTASEPGGEGRRLATELGVSCIEDGDVAARAGDVDAVVVGADAVGSEHFVNKVGTLGLASAARSADVPFFVVAESYKWLPLAEQPEVDEEAFEMVPNHLVSEFLSDEVFPRCSGR